MDDHASRGQWLYRIQPVRPELLSSGPTEAEADAVGRHFNYLKQLCDAGVVILAGRTLNADPSGFGIVIFSADSEDSARELMNNDPAVSEGVFSAELFPYRIALQN
jgi:uncharacterized protein YciI